MEEEKEEWKKGDEKNEKWRENSHMKERKENENK